MKNNFRPIFPLVICTFLCDGYTTFYGPQGQFAGSANTIQNYSTFYGPSGQYAGSANTNPNGTTFYGPSGQFEGYSNSTGEFTE